MELFAAILSIAVALTFGAMSPGPSFILVARTSLAVSRRDGLAAAVGMGIGGVFFSAIALLGLLAILTTVPLLHLALKILGGTYLVYLGYRIWRGPGNHWCLKVRLFKITLRRLGASLCLVSSLR